jgi:hypothetical protein
LWYEGIATRRRALRQGRSSGQMISEHQRNIAPIFIGRSAFVFGGDAWHPLPAPRGLRIWKKVTYLATSRAMNLGSATTNKSIESTTSPFPDAWRCQHIRGGEFKATRLQEWQRPPIHRTSASPEEFEGKVCPSACVSNSLTSQANTILFEIENRR